MRGQKNLSKKLSRDVAAQGKSCMQKIVGTGRHNHTRQLASSIAEITATVESNSPPGVNADINDEEENSHSSVEGERLVAVGDNEELVFIFGDDKEEESLNVDNNKKTHSVTENGIDIPTCGPKSIKSNSQAGNIIKGQETTSSVVQIFEDEGQHCGREPIIADDLIPHTERDIDIEVKREEFEHEIESGTRLKRFTLEEARFSRKEFANMV